MDLLRKSLQSAARRVPPGRRVLRYRAVCLERGRHWRGGKGSAAPIAINRGCAYARGADVYAQSEIAHCRLSQRLASGMTTLQSYCIGSDWLDHLVCDTCEVQG